MFLLTDNKNMRGYFCVLGHSSGLTVFLELRCSFLGTGNVRRQISEHIFAPNGARRLLFIYFCAK